MDRGRGGARRARPAGLRTGPRARPARWRAGAGAAAGPAVPRVLRAAPAPPRGEVHSETVAVVFSARVSPDRPATIWMTVVAEPILRLVTDTSLGETGAGHREAVPQVL